MLRCRRSLPLLPAAATMITPCWSAYWIAAAIVGSVPAAAPARVDDLGAVVDRVVDRLGGGGVGAVARWSRGTAPA